MSDYPGTGRLEPELLAAYIDGELPPEARAKVEAEIAADPENYEWLVNVMAAVDAESIPGGGTKAASHGEAYNEGEVDPEPLQTPVPEPEPIRVIPFYRRRSVVGAIGALAVAASVMLVVRLLPEWNSQLRGPQADPRFAKLVDAVGEERYIEPRITGGFRFGPLRRVVRGKPDREPEKLRLVAIAAELQRDVTLQPTARSLHALGVAKLLLLDFDSAVRLLESANSLDTSSASIVSDLGAAYLARADFTGETRDIHFAVDSFDRAVRLAPLGPEALFGRALALERLGKAGPASEAWAQYLEIDSGSAWSRLAKARREALRLRRSPQSLGW